MFTAGKGYVSLESVEYPDYYVGIEKDGTPRTPSDTRRGRNGQFYVIDIGGDSAASTDYWLWALIAVTTGYCCYIVYDKIGYQQ